MIKNLRLLISSLSVLLIIGLVFTYSNKETKEKNAIDSQRELYAEFLKNSPYQETLTWDKKKRKLEGLPPNRYFEQMWEMTINPSTGQLEDGKLAQLRMQLIQERAAQKNPGDTGNAWEERGPNDIGGRTRAIMFDPNDTSNNTVYAGGVSGGLWVNTDITNSGSSWSRVQNVPGNLSVTKITVDPRNSNIWYVGTGEQYTGGDVVGNGVYVSTDGGINWSAINIPPADGGGDINFNATNLFLSGLYYVNDVVAWDNGSSTELYVAVGAYVYGDAANPTNWLGLQSAGLYRSTDNGSNWNRIESANMVANNTGGVNYYNIPNDIEISADNTLWMGTIGNAFGNGGGRVYSSTNGSTWTEAAASPLTDSDRVELEPSASNPNKLYALTEGNTSPVHIYSTTNAFGSISSTSLPNDADTGIPSNDFCRGQAFYDLMIEADPNNDNILYVGGIDLFRSTNSGSSWAQISKWSNNNNLSGLSASLVHADQHAMVFRPGNSNQAIFGNDGGIYYASSLSSAQNSNVIGARNNNYNVTQYVKAAIGPNGSGSSDVIFTAGAQDNGSQAFRNANADPGINGSEELSDGDGFYTFVDKDGQYMIATFVANVIYRFNLPWNGLGRRQGGATTLSSDQSRGDFVNQMDYDSDANRLLTNNSNSTSNAIKSINVASNSNGSLTNAALTAAPSAFRASPFENNAWYVGLKNGGLLKLTGVTNNGATWTTISTPFVGAVSSVRFGATASDLIITIHNYGVTSVWYSSDAGSNWNSKEGDLPNIPVRDFLLNPLNTDEAIVATQLGVWGTSDFNNTSPTWTQAYNGMSDVSVTSFDYWDISGDDTNNIIIASTYGRGVFTGSFTATTVPDTEAPTVPTNLVASNITENTIDLSWDSSNDNIGVTGYDVYQNGSMITNVSSTTYQATSLTASTTYSFYVIARDAANNSSGQSNIVSETTLAPDTQAPTNPTNLVATNTTDTTTDLSWNTSTDNVGVTEYDVYQGTSVIATVNSSTTSYNVTGLLSLTNYSFSVKAKDDAGNESGSSNIVSVTTLETQINYCTSTSTNASREYISRVQLNSLNNSSSAQTYSDFTNISTTLTKGSQYTVTITPTWNGRSRREAYSVWIDYNKDGDFTDSGEQVYSRSPTKANPVSGSFTVPSGAVENTTRMRVSMKYNGNPSSCETFGSGEVEDYTVNIQGTGPDVTPPVITLNGSSTINLNVGATYNEQGATAIDNIDGDISTNIVIGGDTVNTAVEATYLVTYNVSDSAGNAATEITRTVIVSQIDDTTPPMLTLNGNSPVNLSVGAVYTELGATAIDDIDGDISANVVIGGDTVDTAIEAIYVVTYNVSDASGNTAAEITRTVNVSTSSSTELLGSYFEANFDGWLDGGNDCHYYTGALAFEGSGAIRLRDNSGTSGSMTSPTLDLSSYGEIEVNFYFYPNSMENGEDVLLRYNDGSGWTTIASWISGTDFNNGQFFNAVAVINSNLTSNAQFRIQCDASANNDQVYVDQVIISGSSNGSVVSGYTITAVGGNAQGEQVSLPNNFEKDFEEDFSVFPNPVSENLTIRLALDIEENDVNVSMNIYDVRGGIVKTLTWNNVKNEFFEKRIDISDLSHGVYMINLISTNGLNEFEKLIVK
jgi:chitodextrinase